MKHVLVVDDSPDNRFVLKTLLESNGLTVDEAHHGAEALAKARLTRPDLVISDLLMPVMDGYTLLSHWKADEQLKEIPFVVYTATYTDPKDGQLALDFGAAAFIIKPSAPEPFMAQIEAILSQKKRGKLTRPPAGTKEGESLLKEYNEVLMGKLATKTQQLKKAASDLTAREVQLRAIFDTSPECVKLLDRDGTVQEMNPAGLNIIEADSFEEVEHRCIYPLICDEHRQAFEDLTKKVFAGESAELIFQITGFKGTRRWLETHANPLRDPAGRIIAMLGITRDITTRKQTEEKIQQQLDELQRWQKATLGRENRVLSLKQEVNELLAQVNQPARYTATGDHPGTLNTPPAGRD